MMNFLIGIQEKFSSDFLFNHQKKKKIENQKTRRNNYDM